MCSSQECVQFTAPVRHVREAGTRIPFPASDFQHYILGLVEWSLRDGMRKVSQQDLNGLLEIMGFTHGHVKGR